MLEKIEKLLPVNFEPGFRPDFKIGPKLGCHENKTTGMKFLVRKAGEEGELISEQPRSL